MLTKMRQKWQKKKRTKMSEKAIKKSQKKRKSDKKATKLSKKNLHAVIQSKVFYFSDETKACQ